MTTIFLSAALFSLAEIEFNRRLADSLESAGFSVTLPQEVCKSGDDPSTIYQKCIEGILNSDAVLAVADGPDVDAGVAYEIGFAKASGKRVILLRTDFRKSCDNISSGVNLMLFQGTDHYIETQNLDEAVERIKLRMGVL